jgi:hypothetical protein
VTLDLEGKGANFHRMSLMMLVVFLIQLNWSQILSSCMKLYIVIGILDK